LAQAHLAAVKLVTSSSMGGMGGGSITCSPSCDISDVAQEHEDPKAVHISGGGLSAIRALLTGSVGYYPLVHYRVVRRELPYPLIELLCEFLPLKCLPKVRGLSSRFQEGLRNFLSRNPSLQVDLHKYLTADQVQHKRVWVAVRVKPQKEDAQRCIAVHHNRVTAAGSSFFYDGVFDQFATQLEVWSRVRRPVLTSILDRKHVCFFAYGQTGSGKTHTMFGDREVSGAEGLAFRAVASLAGMINGVDVAGRGLTPTVEFSCLEVYNEKVYDLLASYKELELSTEREVKRAGGKYNATEYCGPERVVAKGLSRRKCDLGRLEEQIGDWMFEGASTRTVGKTVFNEHSSRSHCVATVHVTWEEGGKETRLYLVDLAGSERAGQYALSAEQLKQGVNINKSLSTMARVITVLASGSSEHVPYRDSTLTWLLSEAITGINARTFMVAAVNPLHEAETVSTLKYAQQYSSLQSNQEEINKVGASVRKALAKVQRCRQSLKAALQDTPWSRATLKTQPANSHTRHLLQLLREVERAEEHHTGLEQALNETKKKAKQKEAALIRLE